MDSVQEKYIAARNDARIVRQWLNQTYLSTGTNTAHLTVEDFLVITNTADMVEKTPKGALSADFTNSMVDVAFDVLLQQHRRADVLQLDTDFTTSLIKAVATNGEANFISWGANVAMCEKMRSGPYDYVVIPFTDRMYAHRFESPEERESRLRKTALAEDDSLGRPQTKMEHVAADKRAGRRDARAHWALLVIDKKNRQTTLIDGHTMTHRCKNQRLVARVGHCDIAGAATMLIGGLSEIMSEIASYNHGMLFALDEHEDNICKNNFGESEDDPDTSESSRAPDVLNWSAASGAYIYWVMRYLLYADEHEMGQQHLLRNGLHRYFLDLENKTTWAQKLGFCSLDARKNVYIANMNEQCCRTEGRTSSRHRLDDEAGGALKMVDIGPTKDTHMAWWGTNDISVLVDAVADSDDKESGNEGGSSGDEGDDEQAIPQTSRKKGMDSADEVVERDGGHKREHQESAEGNDEDSEAGSDSSKHSDSESSKEDSYYSSSDSSSSDSSSTDTESEYNPASDSDSNSDSDSDSNSRKKKSAPTRQNPQTVKKSPTTSHHRTSGGQVSDSEETSDKTVKRNASARNRSRRESAPSPSTINHSSSEDSPITPPIISEAGSESSRLDPCDADSTHASSPQDEEEASELPPPRRSRRAVGRRGVDWEGGSTQGHEPTRTPSSFNRSVEADESLRTASDSPGRLSGQDLEPEIEEAGEQGAEVEDERVDAPSPPRRNPRRTARKSVNYRDSFYELEEEEATEGEQSSPSSPGEASTLDQSPDTASGEPYDDEDNEHSPEHPSGNDVSDGLEGSDDFPDNYEGFDFAEHDEVPNPVELFTVDPAADAVRERYGLFDYRDFGRGETAEDRLRKGGLLRKAEWNGEDWVPKKRRRCV
ncbi:hypothetical protein SVAN01_07710 [Stagonosporopsis vannaccii]|nr:hypothetical protein SVAN01_07710 [Stagonosporopsis vannaccii]